MHRATQDDRSAVSAIVATHKAFFPHLRDDYMRRMIDAGQCIWERDVFITFQRYKRAQRIGDYAAQKGDVILHQIGAANQGDGSAADVMTRFFDDCDSDVLLSVRSDNERAVRFYERNGMTRVGVTSWKNGSLPGIVFRYAVKFKKGNQVTSVTRRNKTLTVNKLTVNPDNANTHSDSQIRKLAALIDRYGWTQPLLVDEVDMIIAGEGRYMAAQLRGDKKIPGVVLTGLSASDKKALMIADNKMAELSSWDESKLDEVLQSLHEENFPLAELGFDAWSPPAETNGGESAAAQFDKFSEDDIIDAAFEYYRAVGFPYREHPLHMQMQDVNKLRAKTAGADLMNSTLCCAVADHYHRHRFHASAIAKNSPVEAFDDDAKLRKALALQLEFVTIKTGPFPYLLIVSNTQACANFRPAFAKFIYSKYCAAKAPTILDTSTGYGGRMLGWFCTFDAGHYVGIDPATKTHKANWQMATALGFDKRITLINQPAEDATLDREFDIAFTSPPYFQKEQYSDEDTQSSARYPIADDWRTRFLIPMLQLQFDHLKDGAPNVINVADVTIKQDTFPLVEWTLEAAAQIGFAFVERLEFQLGRRFGANMPKTVSSEPVLVFRK